VTWGPHVVDIFKRFWQYCHGYTPANLLWKFWLWLVLVMTNFWQGCWLLYCLVLSVGVRDPTQVVAEGGGMLRFDHPAAGLRRRAGARRRESREGVGASNRGAGEIEINLQLAFSLTKSLGLIAKS
jgi:hypothetical protein